MLFRSLSSSLKASLPSFTYVFPFILAIYGLAPGYCLLPAPVPEFRVLTIDPGSSLIQGIAPTAMIIRLGLSLLPRGGRGDSSGPQLSTFLGSFYTTDESEDVEMGGAPTDGAKAA